MRKINNLIKILTYSDILILSGWGLVNPIFAVYITSQVQGGNLELVGLASAVFLILKSFVQIPVAKYIDQKKGEIDDAIVMTLGTFMVSLVPFLFILAKTAPQVLALQVFHGLGAALVTPGWMAIFTRHIDRHQEAEEWSIYMSMTSLGMALAGALGGFLAEAFGFELVFVLVGIISTVGACFLFFIYQDIRKAEKIGQD